MHTRLVLVALLLCSCSSTGVVPLDKDTYMVSKRSAKIGFTTADDEKAEVYREANEFCAKQGKKVETVKIDLTNSGFAQSARAALEFKCL